MKNSKRWISLILAIVMISSFACLSVSAKTVYPVGDWVYEYNDDYTEFEIDAYNGDSAILDTPLMHNNTPITSIGKNCFNANTTLKSINLRDSIKYVQSYAFVNASNLETVVCNSNIELIDSYAFSGCSKLSSINIEDTSITAVKASAFMNCDALTEVTLPTTVTSIERRAFSYCDKLAKILIPSEVTSIATDAFYNTPNVVIYCYRDSYAHTYAKTNAIDYVLLDDISYVLGDADNDGKVTVLDASHIQFLLVGFIEDTDGKIAVRGDVSRDTLSIMDATAIQFHLALIDNSLPIGETYYYE